MSPTSLALVAHDVGGRGGMEHAVAQLAAGLAADARTEVTVISHSLEDGLRDRVRWVRVPLPVQRPFALKFVAFYLVAGVKLRRRRFDVVQTVGAIVPNKVEACSVHFCHAGYVSAAGGLTERHASRTDRLNRAVSRWLALRAERWSYRPAKTRRLLPVSDGVSAELATWYPGVARVVCPNGVDTVRFRPSEAPERLRERALLGLAVGSFVVVFVGGDWDRKGLHLVIAAIGRLPAGLRARVDLLVVGPGDPSALSSVADGLGIGGQIQFLGPRDRVEEYLRVADAFMLPSSYETFSLAAHEAAACGVPVVGTDVSGVRELAASGAALVVAREQRALADALASLMTDPGARDRMGRAGVGYVGALSWDAVVDGARSVYRGLRSAALDGGGRAATDALGAVLLFSPCATPGGAERALAGLAGELVRRGVQVRVMVVGHGPLGEWLTEAGAEVVTVPNGRVRDPRFLLGTILAIRRQARHLRPAAVVGNMSKGHLLAAIGATLARTPAVWWQHGIANDRWDRLAARVPAAAVVCGSTTSMAAQRRMSGPSARLELVPPGVQVKQLGRRRGCGAGVRDALGLEGVPLVGIVGRLQRWKGQTTFLRAMALVAESHPSARFLVVGGAVLGWEGDYPQELVALADELGIGARVTFAGHQPDPVPWMDALDIVVHASDREPFGLVIVEAMSLGKAVVAAAEGGPADIITPGLDGLTVPHGEPAALARSVRCLLDDAPCRERLGTAAQVTAGRFSADRTADKMLVLLRSVASLRPLRP